MNQIEGQPGSVGEQPDKPIKFERLSDAPLEELESRLEKETKLIKEYAEDKFKDAKDLKAFADHIISIINDSLNNEFSKNERKKLKDSGKYTNNEIFKDSPDTGTPFIIGWGWSQDESQHEISGYSIMP